MRKHLHMQAKFGNDYNQQDETDYSEMGIGTGEDD